MSLLLTAAWMHRLTLNMLQIQAEAGGNPEMLRLAKISKKASHDCVGPGLAKSV
jgi:hypothetical protein